MTGSIWATLGIAPTNDVTEVRRAYARRLKEVHPEDDPEGFQALRAAYDQATNMARHGWAVPSPSDYDEDVFDDELADEVWPHEETRSWTRTEAPPQDWDRPSQQDSWTPQHSPANAPELPEDIRAELAREQELAEAHKALCDRLSVIISNPAGDRQEALSTMLAIFRSPGMDSLDTHARTEHWLAWVVGSGGPVTEELVEPLIQFFNWNDRPIGVDLSHAATVLQRRDAAAVLRRLKRGDDPDHLGWKVLSQKPTRLKRLRERFTLGLQKRVFALLDRIDFEIPYLLPHLNADAVAQWRERRRNPVMPAIFLWALLLVPPLAALTGTVAGFFGPPNGLNFLAQVVFAFAALAVFGMVRLHGLVRPRARWRDEDQAWGASRWIRLGWAPLGAALLLLSSVLPVTVPWVAAYWLVLGPLVCWTGITNGHFSETRTGLQSGFFIAMIPLGWIVLHAQGPQWVSLCWAGAGITLVAHHGRPALEAAWASMSATRRHLSAAGLAISTTGVAFAIATAPAELAGWPFRAVAAAALLLLFLISRPIRFTQSIAAQKLWFNWMRLGWIPCIAGAWYAPFTDMALATFVAGGLWLSGGALLTFLWEAAPRLDAWLSRGRRRRGALA